MDIEIIQGFTLYLKLKFHCNLVGSIALCLITAQNEVGVSPPRKASFYNHKIFDNELNFQCVI